MQGLAGEAEPGQRFPNETTLGELMSQAGRRCAYVGAWHGGAAEKPQHGFTHWRPWASSDTGWAAGSITRDAVEFLDAQQAGQPFFLVVTYAAPRPPYRGHPVDFDQMYASSTFETLNWLPAARTAAEGKEYLADYLTSMRRYAASVSALDSQIPAIVGALDRKNLRDSTLIVFTSTNGLLAGRHGLWRGGAGSDPWNLYAEGLETPMIWNWPGTVPVEGVRSELAGAYDLFPSLAEVAGAAPPKAGASGGRSYYPLMVNRPLPRERAWLNLVFAAHGEVEMARDARFKLVLRNRGEGPNELYDVRSDPGELSNQFNDDRFVTVRNRLAEAIRQWREQRP
jgi:arylsulfatase A-like enzyme